MPDSTTAEALGAAWIMADQLRPVLCCAGQPVGGDPALRPAARALLRAGIVLSELIVDSRNRVVTVTTLPVVAPDSAEEAAARIANWLHAAVDR